MADKMTEWTVKIKIADVWIADGFEFSEDHVQAVIDGIEEKVFANCTHDGEVQVEVIKRPTQAALQRAIARHDKEVG